MQRATNPPADPGFPLEIKVECTDNRWGTEKEKVPHTKGAGMLVEVLFGTEGEARKFPSPWGPRLEHSRLGGDGFKTSPAELEAAFNDGLGWQGRPQLRSRHRDVGGNS